MPLYMGGASQNAIYKLESFNPNQSESEPTGRAVRVGNLINFDNQSRDPDERVNQKLPLGLEFTETENGDEAAVHMLGGSPPALYTVNFLKISPLRGRATMVHRPSRRFDFTFDFFAAGENEIWAAPKNKEPVKISTQDWRGEDFRVISTIDDPSIATTFPYSPFYLDPEDSGGELRPSVITPSGGMAYRFSDSLFYIFASEALYTVDPISRIIREVGRPGYTFDALAFASDTLYGLRSNQIYTIKIDRNVNFFKVGEASLSNFGIDADIETVSARCLTSDGYNLYILARVLRKLEDRTVSESIYFVETEGEDAGQATKLVDLNLESTELSVGSAQKIFYYAGYLYLYAGFNNPCYKINILNGNLRQVRTGGFNTGVILTGLTEYTGSSNKSDFRDKNLLWAVGISKDVAGVYAINKLDGSYFRKLETNSAGSIVNSNNFGEVNQTLPTGIAFKSGSTDVWYMVGCRHNNELRNAALYTLDPDTWLATRVGNVKNFGVGEYSPTGIAYFPKVSSQSPPTEDGDDDNDDADNNQESSAEGLYMVGAATSKLYKLNTSDGSAVEIANAPVGFGVSEFSPQGLTYIEDRQRAIISDLEEFPGKPAPIRPFTTGDNPDHRRVTRKFPCYLNITFSLGLIDRFPFTASNTNLPAYDQERPPSGFSVEIKNVGTADTLYQYRLKIRNPSLINDSGTFGVSVSNVGETTANFQTVSKIIEYDTAIPKYSEWKNYGAEIQRSQIVLITADLKNHVDQIERGHFYVEGFINGNPYKSTDRITSAVEVTAGKIEVKLRLPPYSGGSLRVSVKTNTLKNVRGILGPIENDPNYPNHSPYFQFQTGSFA